MLHPPTFGPGGRRSQCASHRHPRRWHQSRPHAHGGNLPGRKSAPARSEEHTSELQSLMRISYAVFCLKKKTTIKMNFTRFTYTQLNNESEDYNTETQLSY